MTKIREKHQSPSRRLYLLKKGLQDTIVGFEAAQSVHFNAKNEKLMFEIAELIKKVEYNARHFNSSNGLSYFYSHFA